jgi:hypothetical protein
MLNSRIATDETQRSSYDLDTKILHRDSPRIVGEVDGRRFAPVVYEVPELRF